MKKLVALVLPAVLAACAGGGLNAPRTPVGIPTLQPDNTKVELHKDNNSVETLSNIENAGKLQLISAPFLETDPGELVYQASNGKIYRFNEFTNPIVPTYSSPSYKFPTKQLGQTNDDGSTLIACCTGAAKNRSLATGLDYVRFGIWNHPNGSKELFVGGKVASPEYVPGGSHEMAKDFKGQVTYDVLAYRSNGREFSNSSYTPRDGRDRHEPLVYSRFVADFNTQKITGTIIGNENFGDDVVLQDVNIMGNKFGGTAQSAGQTGMVDGRFFGYPETNWNGKEITGPAYKEIGGKIIFQGNERLDTVFGGNKQ